MSLTKEKADKRADWFVKAAVDFAAYALAAGLGVWLGFGAVVGYLVCAVGAFVIGAALVWKYDLVSGR